MDIIAPTTNPPIKYIKDFVARSQNVFQSLWDELEWVDVAGNRLEYYCNDFNKPYVYGKGTGQREYKVQPYHPLISIMRNQLEALTGAKFEACFLNGYRDGSDHLNWHADDSPEMDDGRPIGIISLGAKREIYFRPQSDKLDVTKIWLESGSLCLMEPGMQDTHYHRIPKSSVANCGPRISLTFRGYTNIDG